MLFSYITIAARNLAKNKLFSLINISGMAISIASVLLIALFVHDESRFDEHVADRQSKFRIYNDYVIDNGNTKKMAMVPPMIAPTLQADFAEVEYYARFLNFNNPVLFEVGNKKLTEGSGGYADPEIVRMFSLELLEGDPNTVLKEPNTIAINETLKKKYFGDGTALGKTISIFNTDFNVVGVFRDFPEHAHLQLHYFLPMANLLKDLPDRMKSWNWSQFHTYVKLTDGADPQQLEAKLPAFAEQHAGEVWKKLGMHYTPHLMPLEDVHLHTADLQYEIAVRGNVQTVYILVATAAFILIIAILNFVNLSTARAINRVKEVGVRKVVGAFRSQLIQQFVSESVIIAFVALALGVMLAEVVLPFLNDFTEKNISTEIFLDPLTILALIFFAIVLGILAGAYPAFYISSYKPIVILAGRQTGNTGRAFLRKWLVVFQFGLSCFLIIASLVASDQHHYMRSKDMGFNKDNLIAIQLRGEMSDDVERTKQVFSNHPNVISSTLGYGLPGEAYAGDMIIDLETQQNLLTSVLTVDHDYVKTLELSIIAGRDFSEDFPSDETSAFIVSEKAARLMGYDHPADALGHKVGWNRWDVQSGAAQGDTLKTGTVIGVVKDFHLNSLRDAINPVVIHIFPFAYTTLTLRVKPRNLPETIHHLESSWKSMNTEWPFEYRFIDDNFDRMYKNEEHLARLFSYFTAFAIFVACLGMFGLVVYSTSQRYKEISIRKVLGARESSLVIKLSATYITLILVAFAIAMPFSYFVAARWLQNFAFHISLSPALFVKAGALIIAIALLTVGLQAFKAARANPARALREQ